MTLQERPRITHQQIADHLGISRAAVTQALHQTRRSTISPELQAQILRAAGELNYRPRNISTYTVALVNSAKNLRLVAEIQFMLLMEQALRDAGFRMMPANIQDDEVGMLTRILTPKTVDGVIFMRWFDGRVAEILPPEIPWLATSEEDAIGTQAAQVSMDARTTAHDIARHLLERGHRRLGLVTGVGEANFHGHLKRGIRDALQAAALPVETMRAVEVRHDRELQTLLPAMMRVSAAPTALICSSPEKALAVLHLLCSLGYRVPRQMSVVSLFDSHLFEPFSPSITATTLLGEETARLAVRCLLERINYPSLPPRRTLVAGRIIERESVALPIAQ